jgi:hypothetical protein
MPVELARDHGVFGVGDGIKLLGVIAVAGGVGLADDS